MIVSSIVHIMVSHGLAHSNGEARRLVMQGAVRLDDVVITDIDATVDILSPSVLRVGRRRVLELGKNRPCPFPDEYYMNYTND